MRFLKDIFEGSFPITQKFGENPDIYSQFGMKGHNGLDFGTPIGTRLYSGCFGRITQMDDRGENGFGLTVVVVAEMEGRYFEIRWAHLSGFGDAKIGDHIHIGQVIGFSGNSGFCVTGGHKVNPEERRQGLGAHLHFQMREQDVVGNILNYNNGFKGAIDPTQFWDID